MTVARIWTSAGWMDLNGIPGATGPQGPAGGTLIPGGTTGQALVKKSNTDHDTEWGTAGAPPEVLVATTQPTGTEILWVDTDEPGVDLSNYTALDTRVVAIEKYQPTLVTSLPGSPVDGQEIYYRFVPNVTPASTIPLIWHLRWDAANVAWLPVGEQNPIIAVQYSAGSTSMGSGSWGTYDANDPRLTIPLAGTYECEAGVGEYWAGVAMNMEQGIAKNGTVWAAGGLGSTPAGYPYSSRIKDLNTFAVNDLVRQFYFLATAGPQNVVLRGRFVQVKPLRII